MASIARKGAVLRQCLACPQPGCAGFLLSGQASGCRHANFLQWYRLALRAIRASREDQRSVLG